MAAIVNVCFDPRLNHEVIRAQVRQRLERLRLPAERIIITADAGGNVGSAFRAAAELTLKNQEAVVLAAVLHHDDCLAQRLGVRRPLAESVEAARGVLRDLKVEAPVLFGTVVTETSAVVWSDEPQPRFEVLSFRMPRLYG